MSRRAPGYPPREALSTRPPSDLAGVEVGSTTALDRPRFLGEGHLDVPHTRAHPVAPGRGPVREEEGLHELKRTLMAPMLVWLLLVLCGVASAAAGAVLGWSAMQ